MRRGCPPTEPSAGINTLQIATKYSRGHPFFLTFTAGFSADSRRPYPAILITCIALLGANPELRLKPAQKSVGARQGTRPANSLRQEAMVSLRSSTSSSTRLIAGHSIAYSEIHLSGQ